LQNISSLGNVNEKSLAFALSWFSLGLTVLHTTFQPLARQHKVVAADEAAYAYVRAKPFNAPLKATARMLLA